MSLPRATPPSPCASRSARATLYDASYADASAQFSPFLPPSRIAAALVSGCSSSSKQSGAALPDAATLLGKSNLTTRNVKSVHLVLSVNGKIKDLPVKTLTGDLTTTPATAAQGNANITFGGSDIDAQFVVDDGTLYAALTPASGKASARRPPSTTRRRSSTRTPVWPTS